MSRTLDNQVTSTPLSNTQTTHSHVTLKLFEQPQNRGTGR